MVRVAQEIRLLERRPAAVAVEHRTGQAARLVAARNTTTSAISSGVLQAGGVALVKGVLDGLVPPDRVFIGVSTYPGLMALTRMLSRPQLGAIDLVSTATPPLPRRSRRGRRAAGAPSTTRC